MVSPTRFLHIANGTATTDLMTRAGIAGDTSIWADPLHEGPVPRTGTEGELLDIRARYLSNAAGEPFDEVRGWLTSWHDAIARSAAYEELVLWFEHDLFDQLNLIHLFDRIAAAPLKAPVVSLICIGSFPGRPDFKGLGELTPEELAPLFDTRQPVRQAQFALARQAWEAFRAPTPEALEMLLAADLTPLPFLGAALRRLLEELPWTRDGLSRTERRAIEIAAADPVDVREAFPHMHRGEDAFYIGDLSFFGVVGDLTALTPPLLTLTADSIDATTYGRAVLAGEADRVTLCGIDRWVGGVHLTGRGPVWRWDPELRKATQR
jgi:hypothetical protein